MDVVLAVQFVSAKTTPAISRSALRSGLSFWEITKRCSMSA